MMNKKMVLKKSTKSRNVCTTDLTKWDDAYIDLEEYIKTNGFYPMDDDIGSRSGIHLAKWVRFNKGAYSVGKIREDRIRRLETLPQWKWWSSCGVDYKHKEKENAKESHRSEMQKLLAEQEMLIAILHKKNSKVVEDDDASWYKMLHICAGHMASICKMPSFDATTQKGIKVGAWAMEQIQLYQAGLLKPSRIKTLSKFKYWKF
ncbi:MAG: helicase associated domain-containing protein [Paraclostridium sp.]